MTIAKEYWNELIFDMVLLFMTYTITKDLIEEGTVPVISFLYNSKVISAIFYAGIMLILVVKVCFYFYINFIEKWSKNP